MCPSTIKTATILPHKQAVSVSPFGFTKITTTKEEKKRPKARRAKRQPRVFPSISNAKVKRRTGVDSAMDMMGRP